MPIRHRLIPLQRLPVHALGGSVTDPNLYFPITDKFYDKNPHLNMWPCGSQVTSLFGKKVLLLGHVIYESQGYRAWVVNKEVEIVNYKSRWGTLLEAVWPTNRPKRFTNEEAWSQFNVHRGFEHLGLFYTRDQAVAEIVAKYEDTFETVVAA